MRRSLLLALLTLGFVSPRPARAAEPGMICLVEGMGSRITQGTLCHRLESMLEMKMVAADDPWARDALGTVRIIGGDVDVLVAVAWRKQRIAWARRSWMELGSNYVSIMGMTVRELLPRGVVARLRKKSQSQTGYQPASILRSEIVDPWVLSRMPRGAGLLPWEQGKKRKAGAKGKKRKGGGKQRKP